MIRALAHVCFKVRDLDAAVAFYVDVLGCTHAFDFTDAAGNRFGAYLHVAGRAFIELFSGLGQTRQEGGAYQHLCLEVVDIESAVRDLRARGTEVSDPAMGSDNSLQAWLSDPEGNRIELHCYTDKSWQAPWLGEEPGKA